MYVIVEHHEERGEPHVVVPEPPGALNWLRRWVRRKHVHTGVSAGGTRHLTVCVNPEAPVAEQIRENFQWGLDVPWEQAARQAKGLLDAKYGVGKRVQHQTGRELICDE